MIESLKISNYALIENVEFVPDIGFSVITGETGAGKSILLGALGLVLGSRADSSVVRDESRKCVVELGLNVAAYGLKGWFDENDLDYDEHSVIRREIMPDGRSRAFVNDTPVNVKLLKELCGNLIDIHSQHASLMLRESGFQTELLDSFCKNGELLECYKRLYGEYGALNTQIAELQRAIEEADKERDYISFRLNRLDEAKLRENEVEEAEAEQNLLENAEQIKSIFAELTHSLRDADDNIVSRLKTLATSLSKLGGVMKDAELFEERLNSALVDLSDMADDADRLAESVEFNTKRLEEIRERLGVLYELQLSFKVGSVEELIATREELRERMSKIESGEDDLAQLKRRRESVVEEMSKVADELHAKRCAGSDRLGGELERLLSDLGIKHPAFRVEVNSVSDFNSVGRDSIRMLFAANKNQEPTDIADVASGGEMSRVMLALKYILSRSKRLPVAVFDEIDTGLSGEAAHRVAELMKRMSENMQLIAVTHLPQIAAAGSSHFMVYKEDAAENTVSKIKLLTRSERIDEIALMISGSRVTPEALSAAEKLLD